MHFLTTSLWVSVLCAFASAGPTRRHPVGLAQSKRDDFQSFNNFGGLSSLSNFDSFNGRDNFDGSSNSQIIIKEKIVVCEQIDIKIIQQKLVVIKEFVKRIIVEQVCEVETQTLVIEQFNSGMDSFSRDVRRNSNRQVSYDSDISNLMNQLSDSLGNLSKNDLGFQGNSVGSHSVSSQGSNWNDQSSPKSVGSIYSAAMNARNSSQSLNASQVSSD